VIAKNSAHANAVADSHACFLCDVGECAVAVVAIKCVWAELIDKIDVVVAVAVKIADGDAAAVVVQIYLEFRPLFAGKKRHPDAYSRLRRAFSESGQSIACSFLLDFSCSSCFLLVIKSERHPDLHQPTEHRGN